MIQLLLLTIFAASAYSELAQIVKPCNRTGDVNACLLNNLESAKAEISNGIPELMIPSLNVLLLTHSSINLTNLQMDLWNVNITGVSDFEVKNVDADLTNRIIKLTIELPHLRGIGSYKLKGNLFNMNLDSMGEFRANANHSVLHYTLKLSVDEKNRDFYLKRESQEFRFDLKHGAFHCHLSNLYLGSVELTEAMNGIINRNSYYMYDMLSPFLENLLGEIVGDALDLLFDRFTFDEMFP